MTKLVKNVTTRPRNVTSIGIQSELLQSVTYFHSEIQDSPRAQATDEFTGRRNRGLEAADNTRIAREWCTVAAQCRYAYACSLHRVRGCIQVPPLRRGNSETPPSALPGSCRHEVR